MLSLKVVSLLLSWLESHREELSNDMCLNQSPFLITPQEKHQTCFDQKCGKLSNFEILLESQRKSLQSSAKDMHHVSL